MSEIEVTEELFDAVAAPILAAAALSMLDAQLDTLTDIAYELGTCLDNWQSGMRHRASADLQRSIDAIREHLNRIEAVLPVEVER